MTICGALDRQWGADPVALFMLVRSRLFGFVVLVILWHTMSSDHRTLQGSAPKEPKVQLKVAGWDLVQI